MREYDARIRELEGVISSMRMLEEAPIPTLTRKEKKRKKAKRKR